MIKKKPIGIILLAIFLIWGIMNTISRIFLRADSSDVLILNHYNVAWVGYIIALILLMLNISALYAVLKKRKWGINILYAFFALNVFFTFFIIGLSFLNLEIAKDAYLESRVSRGLSTKNIDTIMNPATTIVMGLAYAIFYTALAFYVHKKKKYFSY